MVETVKYKAKDGTDIPMFIVAKKSNLASVDSKPAKPLPTLLYAYGCYGTVDKPSFDPSSLPFYENLGGLFAVAHVRGGGIYGD